MQIAFTNPLWESVCLGREIENIHNLPCTDYELVLIVGCLKSLTSLEDFSKTAIDYLPPNPKDHFHSVSVNSSVRLYFEYSPGDKILVTRIE